jgi:hypothetical protein
MNYEKPARSNKAVYYGLGAVAGVLVLYTTLFSGAAAPVLLVKTVSTYHVLDVRGF